MKRSVSISVCVVSFLAVLVVAHSCGRRRSVQSRSSSKAKVAKVVFVDKANACKCTRDRIDGSWNALKIALGDGSAVKVERIHLDTESAKAKRYTKMRPLMVIPGVYFLDEKGGLAGMLQGELKPGQIAELLEKR